MNKPRLSFQSKSGADFGAIGAAPADVLFVGGSVDDRGDSAIAELSAASRMVVKLEYQPEDNNLLVNGKEEGVAYVTSLCDGKGLVRFESTTLGLGELLKGLLAARQARVKEIEFVYVEPETYTGISTGQFLNARDFELTDNRVFRAVHGFAHQRSASIKERYVFFLGYESSRIVQAFEQPDFKVDEKYAIFGVPPFVSGWETNSLANHAADLKNLGFRPGQVLYCAANSLREGYLALWNLYANVAGDQSTFVVSPLGTKPHTVATALFLIETKGAMFTTALYYDHPKRRRGRSQSVRKWHLCRVRGFD